MQIESRKARSLLLVAPNRVAWVESSLPELGADDVEVRTIAGGISIGTELPLFRGHSRASQPVTYPRMTGYESLAEVAACGEAVTAVTPGDRVISFYGHRTAAVLSENRLIPVPQGISARLALLVILACDVAKGLNKLQIEPNEKVLVTGAGAIGLLTVFNLVARGICQVDVVELIESRRRLAVQLGAARAFSFDGMRAEKSVETYAVGVECSSRDGAFGLLQEKMGVDGRVCILADGNIEPLTLQPAFHEKELHIVGSSDGDDYSGYAQWFWLHAQQQAAQLEKLYELTISAYQLAMTFEKLSNSKINPVKVFVRYNI